MSTETTTSAAARWLKLICACAIMMAIGFIYGWSFFSTPIAAEFQWAPTTLSLTFTILMWCFCLGGILGANIAAKTSHRTVLIGCGIGIFLSFTLTQMLVTVDTPWILYVTYGFIGGCSVGAAYTTALGAVLIWFPGRSGTVSGAMLMCYSLSTMVLSSVAAVLFDMLGWRMTFVVLSAFMGAIVIICSLSLRHPSESEMAALEAAYAKTVKNTDKVKDEKKAASVYPDRDTSEMIRQPAFWTYAIWMVIVSCVGLGIQGTINQLALESGAAVAVAVAAVGALAVVNGVGRLVGGFIFDRVGPAINMLLIACFLGSGCIVAVVAMTSSSVVLIFVSVVLWGFGLGGTSVTGSGFTATAFGNLHYSQNLSILNLTLIPAALIGPTLMSLLVTSTASYVSGTSILGGVAFVAVIFAILTGRFMKKLIK